MSKHFKHNWLSLDIVNKGFSDFNSNLLKKKKKSSLSTWPIQIIDIQYTMTYVHASYILNMVEA